MNARTVFVADDHSIVRDGLRAWIGALIGLRWVGDCETGGALIDRARLERWDVLVLDLSLPGVPGTELLRFVRALHPSLRVVVYSMYPAEQFEQWALDAGAIAYVPKSAPLSQLEEALRSEREPAPNESGAQLPHERLSDRERRIFDLVSSGLTPSEIAIELAMAPSTVSTHLRAIREKLGVRSVSEIAQYATRHGLSVH
jgi:DNA-binding NarL/FixJ family response regulator